MITGYLLLALRIIGLGLERPLVKRMGLGYDPFAVTTPWVFFGEVMFAILILFRASGDPTYFQGVMEWLPLALIPGLLYGVSFHAYVNALKIGEVSLLTPLFASTEFKAFAGAESIKGIRVPGAAGDYGRNQLDKLTDRAKSLGAKGLVWLKVTADGFDSPVAKFLSDDEAAALNNSVAAVRGTMDDLAKLDY